MVLRNVVPRQGTETDFSVTLVVNVIVLRNVVPRQGTETVLMIIFSDFNMIIEKCSSPTGDGNDRHNVKHVKTRELRNVVPRQGTETTSFLRMKKAPIKIEKCSSPTGDGNKE